MDSEILDVAVFSLSLMGSNWDEYIKEAYRMLSRKGQIIICDPKLKRVIDEESDNVIENSLKNNGFVLLGKPKITEKFIYVNAIKI